MAKISAYGATEVARVKVVNSSGEFPRLFVLTSTGKILTRLTGELSTSYTIVHRIKRPSARTEQGLLNYVAIRGYTVIR
jgi:hypothetical protein